MGEYNKNISSESNSERKPWNWKINSNKLKALNIVKKKAKLSNIKKISNTANENENLKPINFIKKTILNPIKLTLKKILTILIIKQSRQKQQLQKYLIRVQKKYF